MQKDITYILFLDYVQADLRGDCSKYVWTFITVENKYLDNFSHAKTGTFLLLSIYFMYA